MINIHCINTDAKRVGVFRSDIAPLNRNSYFEQYAQHALRQLCRGSYDAPKNIKRGQNLVQTQMKITAGL